MRREIEQLITHTGGCCPGHDTFPNDSFSNSRSKRARSKGKVAEHKYARGINRARVQKEAEHYRASPDLFKD